VRPAIVPSEDHVVATESVAEREVFSIGHSNQSLEQFLTLLAKHDIQAVIDTRSHPASRFAPHFNRPVLELALPRHSIRYKFRGAELGGRPVGEEFYDDDGYVLYSRVADAGFFQQGIERLERAVAKYRIALLCSEENPMHCHRRLLVGRVLAERGIQMHHIRGDGRLEEEAEFIPNWTPPASTGQQLALFGESEDAEWRSAQSVLRRSPQRSSSAH
jgi:uncharacterized protein (DUF488 family)